MKFSHLADVHIGSWRDPKLNTISTQAFCGAVEKSIEENIDFMLISGDLFNTSLPQVDLLKEVVTALKQLKEKEIPVYMIAGSHDYSPSGKTMLDVLEKAGLAKNVVKGDIIDGKLKLSFTIDPKTGAKITGLLGRKGMLDRKYYEQLDKTNLESEEGFKIFMFHTALSEFKPKGMELMEASPLSLLPKNFNYYAGGHVHEQLKVQQEGYGLITMPGALFPCNFKELEKFGHGGFYLYNEGEVSFVPVKYHDVLKISLDCNHLTPEQVETKLLAVFEDQDCANAIVTFRLSGEIEGGKPSDINFKAIVDKVYQKGAHYVCKNTSKLLAKSLEEQTITTATVEQLEKDLIQEHIGKVKIENSRNEDELTAELMNLFSDQKQEGERVVDFEERLRKNISQIIGL